MIRPLRQRHRRIVTTLAIVLPMAFIAGLAARRPLPVSDPLPDSLAARPVPSGEVIWTKGDLWPGQKIVTTLRRDASGSVAVELTHRDWVKPDVLVYWVPGKEGPTDRLPDDARLLGRLSNAAAWPTSSDARGQSVRLVLYNLADHEIVAVSKALPFPNPRE